MSSYKDYDARYFHKIDVLPVRNTPRESQMAATYIARRSQSSTDFNYLTQALGLDDAVAALRDQRAAS